MTLFGLIVLIVILNLLPQLGIVVPPVLLKVLNVILVLVLIFFLLEMVGLNPLLTRPVLVR